MSFGLDSPILSVAWRMADPFFEAVRDYPYHNRYHTERVFARAMELCDLEKITSDSREEIAIAIIFHDVGYARRYARNEPIGAEIARSLLVTQ
ncbi:MAG TPA: HD domain-containing protein [bacterium]|nr:HD domain-containing protein [bacterium]